MGNPLSPINSALVWGWGGGDMMLHVVACLPSITCAVARYNCLIVLMLTAAESSVIEQRDLPWLPHISLEWLPDHDSWQIPELAQVIVMIPVERQVMLQGNQYQLCVQGGQSRLPVAFMKINCSSWLGF